MSKLISFCVWIDTIKKNTETLIDVSKEVGLEVNTEKTKYMLLSRHQTTGQSHDVKIATRCFENERHFRYLETTVTNQNLIQEEIKKRLNSGNACYHSFQNFLPSRLLYKTYQLKYRKLQFCLWFCTGANLGL
jgi:hypothetical protein